MAALGKTLRNFVKDLGILPRHPYPEQFGEAMDRPHREWADRFYLIASTPRCGSHFLGHTLIENGSLGVPLEYLNKGNAFYWKRRFGTSNLKQLFPHFVQHRTSPSGVFGFKAHWFQFRPFAEMTSELTRGRGIDQAIHLVRRDRLSQAVSLVIAKQTVAWISGAESRKRAAYDYSAIVQAAHGAKAENMAWRTYFDEKFKGQCATVIYEDLLKEDTDGFGAVAEFLGPEGRLILPQRSQKQGGSLNSRWKSQFRNEVRDEDRWILEPEI